MAKSRSRAADYAVFVVIRALEVLMRALPPLFSLPLVDALAWVAYQIDRRHREVAIDNLRQAFPGRYTEKQLRRMVLDMYRHFGRVLLEMALVPRKARDRRWWAELTTASGPLLASLTTSGRPLLFVTAHYGSWELAAFYLRAAGRCAHLVARPIDNPYLDASVRELRESFGHRVLSKQGDLRKMYEALRSGGTLCTLADQDAGTHGLFVDFFGRPASTHRVVAVLAQRTNALIAVVGAQSLGELFRYRLLIPDVIDVNDYRGDLDAERAITQRMTTAVERMVREDPRQYFWLHRRWKHQPPEQANQAKKAA